MSDKWYEILDQALIGAFMMGAMVILISIYYFIRSLFKKAPESSNEPATENQSIGNKVDSFFDSIGDIGNKISNIFTSEPSDEFTRWLDVVYINKQDDIIQSNLKGFKKHHKGIYAVLDDKCGYKHYTWRTAFKAVLHYKMAQILFLSLNPTKKERVRLDKEYSDEMSEFNIYFDDIEKLEEKIEEYSDCIAFREDLFGNYITGRFTQNKLI